MSLLALPQWRLPNTVEHAVESDFDYRKTTTEILDGPSKLCTRLVCSNQGGIVKRPQRRQDERRQSSWEVD